jgi:hypothetical protein
MNWISLLLPEWRRLDPEPATTTVMAGVLGAAVDVSVMRRAYGSPYCPVPTCSQVFWTMVYTLQLGPPYTIGTAGRLASRPTPTYSTVQLRTNPVNRSGVMSARKDLEPRAYFAHLLLGKLTPVLLWMNDRHDAVSADNHDYG